MITFPTSSAAAGGGAAVDGSNITTPSSWRSKLDVPSQADINSRLIGLIGGVVFDNTTTTQRAYASLLDFNVGTSDFSITAKLDIPATAPTGNATIWSLSSSSSTYSAFGLYLRIDTTGSLQLFLNGTATDSYRRYAWSSFVATYGGKTVQIAVTRTSGVIAIYVDSTDITASFSETTNAGAGTLPASWSESIASAWIHKGGLGAAGAPYAGKIGRITVWNHALTSSQVLAMRDTGVPAESEWVYAHGANAVVSAERNSVFSKAATDWVATGGGTSISSAGAVVLGAAAGNVSLSGLSGYIAQLIPGTLYRLSFDVSGGTFGANSVTAYWGTVISDTSVSIGTFNANGSYCFEFTPTFGTGLLTLLAITGASNFSLSNVRISRVLGQNGTSETAGVGGGSNAVNNIAMYWTSVYGAAGPSDISRDTTTKYSGTASIKFNRVSGSDDMSHSLATTSPTLLQIGRKYTVEFWAKGNAGGELIQLIDAATGTAYRTGISLTTSWVKYSTTFIAVGTRVGIRQNSAAAGVWWVDDIAIIEPGALVDFSPSGLDNMTPMWRNGNHLFPDSTIIGLAQDISGRWNGILATDGKPWAAHGQLGRLSRESGAQANGGVVFPGNTNQRLLISNGPAIGTNAIWARCQCVIPAANPGSARGLWCISGSATPGAAANAFAAYITTAGALEVVLYGATGSDSRVLTVYDVVWRFGGRVVDVFVSRATTGAMIVWINGERQFGFESVTGSPPAFTASISSTYIAWACSSTTNVWVGELNRVQIGRGVLTDAYVRQIMNAGVGTGAGASSGTPISRAGIMASQDGLVIENDLTQGWGTTYPDVAAVYSQGIAASNYIAVSNLGDETHKAPSRSRALSYQDADRRFSGGCANGAASVTSYGDTLTVQGTPSSSAADANQPQCINCVTAASAGSLAGYYSSAIHYVARNPRMAALIRLVELTNVSVWVGFHNASAGAVTTDTLSPANSVAAFRFSPTRAGDTSWMAVTGDGAAQTSNPTLVVPTTNVVLLEIEIISGQRVNFYIDGRMVKSNTTNLPSPTASLRWHEVIEARDAVAHNIKFINEDTNS